MDTPTLMLLILAAPLVGGVLGYITLNASRVVRREALS